MTSLRRSTSFPRGVSSDQADLDSSVGDITPVEGISVHTKHQLEERAMDAFLNEMLGGEGNRHARERFRALWDVSWCCSGEVAER